MPVKKTTDAGLPPHSDFHLHHIAHGKRFGMPILMTLAGILLVYTIFLFGTMIRNKLQEYHYIGYGPKQERLLVVDGMGKVTITPDIATTQLGLISEGETVADAQTENTKTMNTLIDRLKQMGIAAEDIQTANYNVYPQYDYTEKDGRVLRGYEVSQSVEVKIRDVAKSNQVLALAGELGINSVSGIQFTIDEPEAYKEEARLAAVKDAQKKAAVLAQALGVRVGRVVSYNEFVQGGGGPIMYGKMDSAMGLGGGAAPSIEAGTNEVILQVTVGYEMR